MAGMIKYMTTNPNFLVVTQAVTLLPTFELGRSVFFNLGASNTPVAYSERLASRLIPYQSMGTADQQAQLGKDVAAVLATNMNNDGLPASDVPHRPGDSLQIYSTGAKPTDFGGPSGADTGVNTAWRSSLWEVVSNSAWTSAMSQPSRNTLAKQTSQAMDVLRKYGTGTYFSESDVLETSWQTAFFGSNYDRLLRIKQKYDPDMRLVVYKGIGYAGQEGQSAFQCYEQA